MKLLVLPELRFRRLWFCLGLGIAVAIAVVCLMPGRNIPQFRLVSDKVEHALAFAMLAFWFGSILVRRDLLWLALALVAFGGLIEVAQGLMGLGRHADLLDLVADTVGVVVGLLLALTPLGRWAGFIERMFLRPAP
ncbi:MAG TPA: VanZ family protein [Steroidobacteraceae bacterium]|nr:VanZ family protein [Steroidobacteraceae bacterium]